MGLRSKLLIIAMAVLSARGSTAADMPAGTAKLLDAAAQRFDLQRKGTSPIEMRARVVAIDVKGDEFEGNYHLLWLSPTTWIEEIAFPTFWEVSGRTGQRSWRKRKLEFSPDPVRWVRTTVHFAERLKREATWTGDPVVKKRVRGVERTCAKVRPDDGSSRRWCFEPNTGDLMREDADSVIDWGIVIEYGDWREAEGKRFPGRIVYSAAKRKRIELSVTEFAKPQEGDPARFDPPQGAEEDPVCESLQPPRAPSDANSIALRSSDGSMMLRGEATLEFRVAVDGSARRIQIVSATSPQFGHGLAEIVSKMKFTPALCDGRPVEMSHAFRRAVR